MTSVQMLGEFFFVVLFAHIEDDVSTVLQRVTGINLSTISVEGT